MVNIIPHFYTSNLHRTIAYYTNVLWFDIVLDVGEISDDSCMLRFGDSNIVFEESPFAISDVSRSQAWGKLNIFVDGIDQIFQRVSDFADVRQELVETTNETSEFSVRDCNGIELVFTEVNETQQYVHVNSVDDGSGCSQSNESVKRNC